MRACVYVMLPQGNYFAHCPRILPFASLPLSFLPLSAPPPCCVMHLTTVDNTARCLGIWEEETYIAWELRVQQTYVMLKQD